MAIINALEFKAVLGLATIGLVVAIGSILVRWSIQSRRPKDFPPGPKTLPILGNLINIPTTKSFLKFHELGKQYGSIMGFKLGPQNMVILNDYKHVAELFDRRGGIYSSRPENHIANDIMFTNSTHMLFLPYGDDWRILRKTVQDVLRTSEVDKMLPVQNAESIQTLYYCLKDPNSWYNSIRRYSSAVILATVFGLRGATFDSPRVKELYQVQDQNTAINELGATPPVNIFPFLKSLPDFMSPWRVWARSIRKEYTAFLERLVADFKASGNTDCFMAKMLREQEKNGLDEEHIAYIGTTMMEAGSDTTASMLLSFLMAMAKHPEVLKKCQDEVDSVCGLNRSPGVQDDLPYLRAVMNETLRWRPVAAGGVPHLLTRDDTYGDYFFPKGTMFFANAWSIHRTSEFESPDDFVPERWLENKYGVKTEKDTGDDKRRVQYGFGAGRRACSGQRLAENSLIINMAKLVWAFELTPAGEIDDSVETGYFGGFLICPKEFPLDIKVRSEAHAAVIEREMEDVRPFLAKFKE